jgi:N-acetyl-gamma-glutamyl-phosphate reductase
MSTQAKPGAVRVAVVGATGYTGAELLRLLGQHPRVHVDTLVGHSRVGEAASEALPSLTGTPLGARTIEAFDAAALADRVDAAFCALPHGASAPTVAALRDRGVTVFDLSADFRLRDRAVYEAWYGEHGAPERFGEGGLRARRGLPGAAGGRGSGGRPGCYPTATVLPLWPLVRRGWVTLDRPIVVDAKSGVSGAGRKLRASAHFSEVANGIRPYATAGRHRHTPEIEQELSAAAGAPVRVLFSPHLVPMVRGLLAMAYVEPTDDRLTAEACVAAAREDYAGSPAVVVLDADRPPDTQWAQGANRAFVGYTKDPRTGWIVAEGAIDNLVKGAAGQAIQGFNVRFGFPEALGLELPGAWP